MCMVMLLPIVLSMLASVKSTAEAAAWSRRRTSRRGVSLDSYQRLWDYQAGLPAYLVNSFGTAFMTIAFTLAADDPGRATRWRASRCRARKRSSSSCCWR